MRFAKPLLSFVLALFVFSSLHAGLSTDFVRSKQKEIMRLFQAEKSAKSRVPIDERLEKIIDDIFDYQAVVEGILDNHSQSLTAEQRNEIINCLAIIIRKQQGRIYKSIYDYKSELQYTEEQVPQNAVLVKSCGIMPAKSSATGTVCIAYLVYSRAGSWKARDCIIDGVSFVGTQRNNFLAIVREKGIAEYIVRLKQKVGSQ